MSKVKIIKEIGAELLDLRFMFKTDDLLTPENGLDKWKEYADYYDKINDYFETTTIARNPYLSRRHQREFHKKYLGFIDKSADYALESSGQEIVKGQKEILSKYNKMSSKYMLQMKHKEEKEGFEGIKSLLSDYQDIVREKASTITKYHEEKRLSIEQPYYFFLHNFLDQFHSIYSKCESPLEEAFFIAIINSEPFDDTWIYKERFDSQVRVGNEKIDFVYTDREKDIRIAIQIDDKYPTEKTEKQLEEDKITDTQLKQMGWHILRFNKLSIETELDNCVNRVKNFYKLKSEQLERVKRK